MQRTNEIYVLYPQTFIGVKSVYLQINVCVNDMYFYFKVLKMESCKAYSATQHSVKTMETLRNEEKHCDAVIEAGGEKFKIHKSVFAIYSDYFDKVFTVEMQEKYSNVVKVEDTRCDVMKCIIDFIYTGQLSINHENAIELLVAADYLQIEKIKELSVKYLLSNLDTENCVSVWTCAWTYNVEELLDKSVMVFASNLMSVPREELECLTNDQFVEIMESSKKVRKSEEASFAVTANWAKCDLEKRKRTFCKILQTFEMSLFSMDFLISIAKDKTLDLVSGDLPHKIVMELVSRMEKGSQRHEELKKVKQATTRRVNGLIKENKRLSKRFEESVKDAGMLKESSMKRINELSEENQRLTDLVTDIKEWAKEFNGPAKRQQKESEKKIDMLIEENNKLERRLQESQIRIKEDTRQQQGLYRKIDQILKANHSLWEANQTLGIEIMALHLSKQ